MNIKVDKNTVNYIYSDKAFFAEIEAFLNSVIDEEIEKADDMDTELIDECIELLSKLDTENSEGHAVIIPMLSSKKIMNACHKRGFNNLSRGMRASLIACIVLLSALTANTVIAEVFDYNIAKEVVSSISQKLQDWGIIAGADDSTDKIVDIIPETTTQASTTQKADSNTKKEEKAQSTTASAVKNQKNGTAEAEQDIPQPAVDKVSVNIEKDAKPVALRLSFLSGFKTEYLWGENLDTSGLIVTAVYEGGAVKTVSTSDCTFTGYNKALEGTQKIIVTYNGASETFEITLRKTTQKTEKKVTGALGTAPTKLVYTTQDTQLDLRGLSVRAVYSDGTYSTEYGYKSAVLITDVDFSIPGERQVTVRIADLFEYSFTIMIEDAQPDVNITCIKLDYTLYHFYLGEEPDYSKMYIRVEYENGKSDVLNYNENKKDIFVTGVDTQTQTLGYTKPFTVHYQGHSVSARYTVESRNTVISAKFDDEMYMGKTKFLYYYGEPLCLGKDYTDADLLQLPSTSVLIDDSSIYNDLLTGEYWRLVVYWSGKGSGGYQGEYYYASQLDFYGYDPYTLGYQSIDIFYEGIYLTTMTVFVYGDEGYAPTERPETQVIFGDEESCLKTGSWLRCLGNGELTYRDNDSEIFDKYSSESEDGNLMQIYKKMEEDPLYKFIKGQTSYAVLEDENAAGWQNAMVKIPGGETYTYKVCHVYNIVKTEKNYDSDIYGVYINDFANKTYDDISFKVTLSDGTVMDIPASETSISYYQNYIGDSSSQTEIAPETEIHSMIVTARFLFDRTKYCLNNFVNASSYPNQKLFVYSDGYKDAYNVELLVDPSNQDTFLKGTSESYLTIHAYPLRLHTYDNYYDVISEDVTVSGVDCNEPGEYTATFSFDFCGETLSVSRTIYIVDKFADYGLRIVSDPNSMQNSLLPGDTMDIDGIELEYTDKKGKIRQLTADDVTFEITEGGSGHTIDSDLNMRQITVKYTYINEWGAPVSCVARYTPWGYMPYTGSFGFSPANNAVSVKWDALDGADYYIVTCLGETYETADNHVYCDRNLENRVYYNVYVYIRPVKIVDGEKRIGCGAQVYRSKLEISGYVPPQGE